MVRWSSISGGGVSMRSDVPRSTAVVAAACLAISMLVPPASAAAPQATGDVAVKAPIVGLIDRQGEPPAGLLPYVHAFVVSVNWADLQPAAFGPITPGNAIDQAIGRVREPDYA